MKNNAMKIVGRELLKWVVGFAAAGAALGLSLWLQRGCAQGRFLPGRRRFCTALAVVLGVAAPFALLPGLICMGLWLLCLWS